MLKSQEDGPRGGLWLLLGRISGSTGTDEVGSTLWLSWRGHGISMSRNGRLWDYLETGLLKAEIKDSRVRPQ